MCAQACWLTRPLAPRSRPVPQVIYGAGHEAGGEGGAVPPSAADAEPVNALRWASLVGDARLGVGLYEALPHLCRPLA